MNEWSRELEYEVDNGVHLRKKTMEDLSNVGMTGGGGVATLKTKARGCSLLVCTNCAEGDASNTRHKDIPEKEIKWAEEMGEALALLSSKPRPPTTTFTDMKVCITTFTGLLWALFGDGATTIKSANYLSDYG